IFKQGLAISDQQILRTGVTRTDFFFDALSKEEVGNTLEILFPIINEKKVILYAPTYRDNELNVSDLKLDIKNMYSRLREDHVLFLRLHPAVTVEVKNTYPDFVYNVSNEYNINHLLLITDILITDYSSIPFEFALLQKPMVFFSYDIDEYADAREIWDNYDKFFIMYYSSFSFEFYLLQRHMVFFAYDIDEYADARGFWDNYDKLVPGPIVENTDDLIDILKTGNYDIKQIETFSNEWNQYSDGNS